jgi:hypothetical protein
MGLRIIRSTDVITVTTISAAFYAEPGIGKTSLGFTAEAPLLVDFDHGAYRSKNRGDSIPVDTWADVASITAEDVKGYKTLVLDTAGRALDSLALPIIKEDSRNGRGGGALSLQGYGVLKARFTAWMNLIRSFGMDVVLLCHSDEQRKGDDLIVRLDVQGGSKGEIYKSTDMMGRIYMQNGDRMLNMSPTDIAFGKDPGQLGPITIPNYAESPRFLAEVIKRTKDKLNEMSESQREAQATLAAWAEKIGAASTEEHFNGLLAEGKECPEYARENVKRLLIKAARAKGMEYDMATKGFKSTTPLATTGDSAKPAEEAKAEPVTAEVIDNGGKKGKSKK